MTDTPTVPAGWYPDPNAPGGQRWWDGTQWTEHVGQEAQPYQAFAPEKAPEGTNTNTVWIWILAVTPLLSLLAIFLVDWKAVVDAIIPTSLTATPNPYAQLAIYASPGYILTSVLSWVFYAASVVLAVLDWRQLKQRQVPRPFHWAFAFLPSLVYVIGRTVVVRRRTGGGGLGPLWTYIASYVVVMIAYIVLFALVFSYMFQQFGNLSSNFS